MPLRARHRPIASHELVQHFSGLPVVKAHEATSIARHDELPVRRDVHVDGISGAIMALEHFLAILPESVRRGVHDDLVVAGLECNGFPGRVRRRTDQAVHVRLGNSLDGHGDADLPGQDGFIVGAGDHAAVFVDKSYCCRCISVQAE